MHRDIDNISQSLNRCGCALFSRAMRELRFYNLIQRLSMVLSFCVAIVRSNASEPDLTQGRVPMALNIWTNAEAERALLNMRAAPGFRIDLTAAEPMFSQPASFAFDSKGRIYVVESHRRKNSVYDIATQTNWIDADAMFRNVGDRSNFLQKVLIPENKSLPDAIRKDLNGDGKFDFNDLAIESERVRLIEDRNGDGKADYVTTFADGFRSGVAGAAGGILQRGNNVWFSCIPDLWLLRDTAGFGQADQRKSLQFGFGVHIGLRGHDLQGITIGPDDKIYFAMGDRGFSITTNNRTFANPDSGAVMRCNPDGTDFEVIATGLCNPRDLVFDQLGNLWVVDSAGEFGDKSRLLLVIEGADFGWHVGWQRLGKSSVWITEKLWETFPANSAAYILPPVANIGCRPAGFAFYPGSGLPAQFDNHFFLCDLQGQVISFGLQSRGPTFELVDLRKFLGGLFPVDVDFGPEDGVYVLDQVDASGDSGKGRIYRVYDSSTAKEANSAEPKRILSEGMQRRSPRDLIRLLEHRDKRVRQEAQFALAEKGVAVTNQIFRAAAKNANPLVRLHAIWALGQIGRTNSDTLASVLALLSDPDSEIRAQAARVLGDGRLADALDPLARMLQDPSPRVRLFATLSLGKLGRQEATEPILQMLRDNADRDLFLRHAGVTALVWLNDMNALLAAAKDPSAAVRMGVLLAMRRLSRPELAIFIYDTNPALVLEAARAIYDLPIESAMTQLAVLLGQTARLPDFKGRGNTDADLRAVLLRRSLNANYRLGKLENALSLTDFASKKEFPEALRVESIELLARWAKPQNYDPVVGLWRPLPAKEPRPATLALRGELSKLLKDSSDLVRISTVQAAVQLQISSVAPALFEMVADTKSATDVRLTALRALADLKGSRLGDAASIAVSDRSEALRIEGARWMTQAKPDDAIGKIASVLEKGTLSEKQSALSALGAVTNSVADQILLAWLDLLKEGKVPNELRLDLVEVARKRSSKSIHAKLEQHDALRPGGDPLAPYKEVLYGGNADAGRKIFFDRADVGCSRCHKVNGNGGDSGPDLSGIGTRRKREHLLESLLLPNKEISTGYETVVVTMKSGKSYSGRVKNETAGELLIISPTDGFFVLGKNQIQSREHGVSEMPADAGKLLSKREIRDLLEYLAALK